jgi:hypothetical protein
MNPGDPNDPRPVRLRPWMVVPAAAVLAVLALMATVILYQSAYLFRGPPPIPGPPADMAWVEPADVYGRVAALIALCQFGIRILYLLAALTGILITLVLLQIALKGWIFRPLVGEMWLSRQTNEATLGIVAQHGKISDSNWRRMEDTLTRSNRVLEALERGAEVTASQATLTASQAEDLKAAVARVEHQTNAMKDQLVAGAGREGVTRGRAEEKAEEKARADAQLERVEHKVDEVRDGVDELKERVKPNGETSER